MDVRWEIFGRFFGCGPQIYGEVMIWRDSGRKGDEVECRLGEMR